MRTRPLVLALTMAGCRQDAAIIEPTDTFASELPIALVETWGRRIPDDPKIPANLRIIRAPGGGPNALVDEPRHFDGDIGIEVRGRSSRKFPKQQFGFDSYDAWGDRADVSLLDFPDDSDWILHGPWSDKTFMRNHIAYWLATRMGRYASRTTYLELFVNTEGSGFMSDQYWGLYLLMEKVKWGEERVDVSVLEPDQVDPEEITGGYIMNLDFIRHSDNDCLLYLPEDDTGFAEESADSHSNCLRLMYPEFDDARRAQREYITDYVLELEQVLHSADFDDPDTGYEAYIDVDSFIDYLLLFELVRNDDGLRRSTYMHKDRGDKLKMGPLWDCNICLGNVNYHGANRTSGWQLHALAVYVPGEVPFWWSRLLEDERFRERLVARWWELREEQITVEAVDAKIATTAGLIREAQARDFERWPALGTYRKFNPEPFLDTWDEEVERLAAWLEARILWMDDHIEDYNPPDLGD